MPLQTGNLDILAWNWNILRSRHAGEITDAALYEAMRTQRNVVSQIRIKLIARKGVEPV